MSGQGDWGTSGGSSSGFTGIAHVQIPFCLFGCDSSGGGAPFDPRPYYAPKPAYSVPYIVVKPWVAFSPSPIARTFQHGMLKFLGFSDHQIFSPETLRWRPTDVAYAPVPFEIDPIFGVGSRSYHDWSFCHRSFACKERKSNDEAVAGSLLFAIETAMNVYAAAGLIKGAIALGRLAMAVRAARVSQIAAGSVAGEAVALGRSVRYGPHELGPLDVELVKNFRGGSYSATTLSEPLTLYRGYGGLASDVGGWWTRLAPNGMLQLQLDSALVPSWGNTLTGVSRIRVPAGTTIYEGFAAPQGMLRGQKFGGGSLLGGGSQVFIPNVSRSWLIP